MEQNSSRRKKQQNRVIAGLILVIAGAVLLLQNTGVIMAAWLFSWPVILIAAGFFSGLKHNFRNRGWIFMMGAGGFFLLGQLLPGLHLASFIWPVAIIAAGIFFILRPPKTNWKSFNNEGCRHRRFNHAEEVKA